MPSTRELRDRAIIRPVKQAVEDQLLDLPGVVAVDIGEKRIGGRGTGEQVIVVSVPRKIPPERLRPGVRVPPEVLGVRTDVIEEHPQLHHEHCGLEEPPALLERRCGGARVVAGGAGIAPCRPVLLAPPDVLSAGEYRRIGTLGALVVGHGHSPVVMGLTTFDVACMDDAWTVGDRMIDPEAGHVYADLARAALSGRVDAAAVTIGGGLEYSCSLADIGPVTGQDCAYPGETVRKKGYGTGVTRGTVISVDATLRLDHGAALGVRILREQIRVVVTPPTARFAGRGDAGAALIYAEGRVVGLHLGGSRDGTVGFACPIASVLTELDVDLRVEPQRLHA